MALLKIRINDEGNHWDKMIWFIGIKIYHRHDYRGNFASNNAVGFNVGQYCTGDIDN